MPQIIATAEPFLLLGDRSKPACLLIHGFTGDPMQREAADRELRTIDGLQKITILVKPADAGQPGAVSSFMGITGEAEAFPIGYLFRPLIADPKQPQFFVASTASNHRVCASPWRQAALERHSACTGSSAGVNTSTSGSSPAGKTES